jgi:hypothetical protein
MRKIYRSPELRSEKLDVGVFGCYNSTGGSFNPIGILWPMFGFCCS